MSSHGPSPTGPPGPPVAPPGSRGVGRLAGLVWLILSIALVGVLVAAGTADGEEPSLVSSPPPAVVAPPVPQSSPSPPRPEGDYKFLFGRRVTDPIRWDPCTPIHYETDLALAPPGAIKEVHEAIYRTEEATGLQFVDVGSRPHRQLDRAIDRELLDSGPDARLGYETVLIAWVSLDEFSEFARGKLKPGTIGMTRVFTRKDAFVTGTIEMLAEASQGRGFGLPGFGSKLQHELGHLVGLDHADDLHELMNPTPVVLDWGPGDLIGLSLLGAEQGCLDTPDPTA